MTDVRDGVSRWATDFNHADPAYNANAHAIWDELRDGGCPVAHTDRYGGMWAPLTHELVHEVAYDTEHFTSNGVVVSNARPGIAAPVGPAPPITSDPPFHQIARRLLLPPFSPKSIDPWESDVQRLCDDLLDRIGTVTPGASIVDAAVQYAQSIPVNVIARMLGFPPDDEEVFRGFVHNVIEQIDLPAEERIANFQQLDRYIDNQIADHVANPRDDLTSYLLEAELDGHRLAYEHVRGSIVLLLIAGIDTTWSAIGSSLWHLATNAGDLERLVADPSVVTFAVEEFLRAYAPVTMARLVKDDYDFHGCPMKAAEWVLLPFPAANRDPAFFDRAGDFVIDRAENRHAAFGLGIHRCIGSNLARLEVRVAVERFVRRFPRFELAGEVTWSQGQIRGPRVLPVRVLATA
jgi:cytochrome P450